jgi:hypothetical protein
MENQDLARQIKQREKQVKKYVEFALQLIKDIGKVKSRQVESAHTKIHEVIEDFGGFAFDFESGTSCMGGNYLNIVRLSPNRDQKVLSVYWQVFTFNITECRVDYFDSDSSWLEALDEVIRNKKKILAAYLKKKDERHKDAEEWRRERELHKTAIRLGLEKEEPRRFGE